MLSTKRHFCNFAIPSFSCRVFPICTDGPANWKCSFAPIKFLICGRAVSCRDKIASGDHRADLSLFPPFVLPPLFSLSLPDGKVTTQFGSITGQTVYRALTCADGNQAWRCTCSRFTDKRIKHPVMESAPNHTRSRRAPRADDPRNSPLFERLVEPAGRTFSLETRFPSPAAIHCFAILSVSPRSFGSFVRARTDARFRSFFKAQVAFA